MRQAHGDQILAPHHGRGIGRVGIRQVDCQRRQPLALEDRAFLPREGEGVGAEDAARPRVAGARHIGEDQMQVVFAAAGAQRMPVPGIGRRRDREVVRDRRAGMGAGEAGRQRGGAGDDVAARQRQHPHAFGQQRVGAGEQPEPAEGQIEDRPVIARRGP
ncbi:hypothetical protein SDC9_35801 [bioreactor metagenome]|uniref:Uncharacterized protein n=1 Tax=bioreactor metagenome TaxID=1076179 RepID=A0A644VEG5_9ZZZZ